MVYRAEADRLIVRDVKQKLREMRRNRKPATWRWAVVASHGEHPEWFRHYENMFAVEPLLRDGGVDMEEDY